MELCPSGYLETELQQVERQLKALEREQEQLLQWALKGFPEVTVIAENKRINSKRETLKAQKAELETQIKASQDAAISLPKLGRMVELIRKQLKVLEFESKRQVLDMLGITVWLDSENIEITGVIPVGNDVIATAPPLSISPPLQPEPEKVNADEQSERGIKRVRLAITNNKRATAACPPNLAQSPVLT